MARPRRYEQDPLLTDELDIEDVAVIDHPDTDEDNYYAMLDDWEIPFCSECGCKMKNHDLKEKVFLDVIEKNGKHFFIKLHYMYHRYRCTSDSCHRVLCKRIKFADLKARTTYRAEAYIVDLAMVYSYRKIEKMIAWNVSDSWNEEYSDEFLSDEDRKLTAQGVGEVVRRWVSNKDGERLFVTPMVLGLRTCNSGIGDYIIAFDATTPDKTGYSDTHIIEVLRDVSTGSLSSFLGKLDKDKIEYVFLDFNETIINILTEILPNAILLIGPDAVLESTIDDFNSFLNKEMRQLSVELKEAMLGDPGLVTAVQDVRLQEKFEQYSELNNAYHFVERLWNLIINDNPPEDLQDWNTELSAVCPDDFELTSEYVETFWNQIYNYYMRRHVVDEDAYERIKRLDMVMRIFKNFSPDVMRAKILYLGTTRDNPHEWRGIKCEEVMTKIKNSPREQRRVNHYEY